MVTTRARARAEHVEGSLATVVDLIMEQLQPADMKNLRLTCASVRQAVDRAVQHLAILDKDLVHLSQSSFKPTDLSVCSEWRGPGLVSVPPGMADCLKHVWRLRMTHSGFDMPVMYQALQPCCAQLKELDLLGHQTYGTAHLLNQMPHLQCLLLLKTELKADAATALRTVSSLRTLILEHTASAAKACDLATLTQLTQLQLKGPNVLTGDLQPLSEFQKLEILLWELKGEMLVQQDWTPLLRLQARQWSRTASQAVQQWLAPSWSSLKHLHLDIEMDRATLQAVASHCPRLEHLGCSTLSIKESQPQIQLPSLRHLSFTFNMTGGTWKLVPVAAYAALKAPVLEMMTYCQDGMGELIANILVDTTNSQDLRDAELAAAGALRAVTQILFYTGPEDEEQPDAAPALQALKGWQPTTAGPDPPVICLCEIALDQHTLKHLPPCVGLLNLSGIDDIDRYALDPLAGHSGLVKLRFHDVLPSCKFKLRLAILRLLGRAQQGSRLSILVPEVLFSTRDAAQAEQEAARVRVTAGTAGGVPALVVEERNA